MKKVNGKWIEDVAGVEVSVAVAKQLIHPIKPAKRIKSLAHQGIYVILCEKEKHVYVGMSKNMPVRLRNHKMEIGDLKSKSPSHKKMREHYYKHGEKSFQFIEHLTLPTLPDGTIPTDEILTRESEVMTEFSQKGYTLYNAHINTKVRDGMIHCPREHQPLINDLVKVLTPDNLPKIRAFVNSLTH